jgi:hypothetical protein
MGILMRTADLLQDAIEGSPTDHRGVRDLLPTVIALESLSLACRPEPGFVGDLGRRLQAEAAELAAARSAARIQSPAPPAARRPREPKPVIILVGRGLPRLLAGVTASALAVGGVVGVASRSALPGQLLYPVKQALDSAAVSIAGSDFDKGSTLLGQAQEHISEASDLAGAPSPAAADVDGALQGAIDDVTRGQALLRKSFAETHNPQAMLVMQDLATRAMPQVDALHDRVPSESLPLVTALHALLGSVATGTVAQLASCETCGASAETARQALAAGAATAGASPIALPDVSAPATVGGTPGAVPVAPPAAATAVSGVLVVTAPALRPALRTAPAPDAASVPRAAPAPLVPASTATVAPAAAVQAGVRLPSVNAGISGVAVSTGGVGAGLPVGGATVGLPSSTVGTGGVTVGGGSVGATLPSVSITAPLPAPTLATTGACVQGVCLR